jgi:hypothetical protein
LACVFTKGFIIKVAANCARRNTAHGEIGTRALRFGWHPILVRVVTVTEYFKNVRSNSCQNNAIIISLPQGGKR